MSQGIGVRYSATGARILGLEHSGDGLRITGMSAGPPGGSLTEYITSSGFGTDDAVIACGLCPGDFITASIIPEEGLEHMDLREQLRWEIERKMISDPAGYVIDYAIADLGFVFAGRKKHINSLKGSLGRLITDVETVALFNGCDAVDEIGLKTVLLVSVEAEGISSVLLDGGELKAMESFPVREEALASVLPALDPKGMKAVDNSSVERLAGYVMESYNRITNCGGTVLKPESIVLAGSGACTTGLAGLIGEKTEIATAVSDPFSAVSDDITSRFPELAEMGAAFTTCFGLAVRALND